MPFTLAEIRVLLLTHTFHDVLWGGTALSFPYRCVARATSTNKDGTTVFLCSTSKPALTARLLTMTPARSRASRGGQWVSRHAPIDPASPDLPSWITCVISEAAKRQGDRTL